MTKNNFHNYTYVTSGLQGLSLTEALRLWKTKYQDFKDFQREVINHEGLKDFEEFVLESWDDIEPVTVQEALALENTEKRRVYFDCIGVNKLFTSLEPKLLDRQVINKKRTRWDDNNDPYTYEFEDVYELYELDGEKLFGKDRWGRPANPVFSVRCWCTTTNREYWIYVPMEAAVGVSWRGEFNQKHENPDAIRAIAWTIRIDITNPERIYRQGDIIVAKHSKDSGPRSPYHLSKDEYLQLMYSET